MEYELLKKQFHREFRDKINSQRRELIVCECGKEFCKGAILKHKKTKKRIDKINGTYKPSNREYKLLMKQKL